MDRIVPAGKVEQAVAALRQWVEANVVDPGAALQLGAVVGAYLVSLAIAPPLRRALERMAEGAGGTPRLAAVARIGASLAVWAVWLALIALAMALAKPAGLTIWLLELVASLVTAWIVIRIAGGFIENRFWSAFVAVTVWGLAGLNIFDLAEPTARLLDSFAVTFGSVRISALGVIKGAFVMALLLWLAVFVSDLLERQIEKSASLTPSVQVLFTKFLKVILIATAIATGINSVGIDLTAFAVFTGALGLGIGFGLQKVISNLVSGVILLLDRSIKPGDVITVGETFGWVNAMGARYTSLLTRDGIEHLVPNEDLITQRVENWSYSDNMVRIAVHFGVHYRSDVKKARELALEAADECGRALAEPKPVCSMTEFGDSSVNFRLRVWINDPQNGTGNVRGDILMRLWDKLHAHDIEIPYPQRDLHLRSSEPLTVRLQGAEPDAASGPA